MSILMEAINEINEETYQEPLNEIEILSEVGSMLLFIKNNYRDCIDIYGAKATSDILEEANIEYKNLLESMSDGISSSGSKQNTTSNSQLSNNIPDKKTLFDFNKIWETIEAKAGIIGGVALATLAIAASYKIYKNYFSKAAKSCKGRTGSEKEACMTNYKTQAYKMQKMALDKSLSLADKTDSPKKFKQKIQIQINKISKK